MAFINLNMREYQVSDKNVYPKLHAFLEKNNLGVHSSFSATDLDCAFHIRSNDFDYCNSKIKDTDFFVCFMHCASRSNGFSWGLSPEKVMNEDEFIEVLKEILVSDKRFISWGQNKYNDKIA